MDLVEWEKLLEQKAQRSTHVFMLNSWVSCDVLICIVATSVSLCTQRSGGGEGDRGLDTCSLPALLLSLDVCFRIDGRCFSAEMTIIIYSFTPGMA